MFLGTFTLKLLSNNQLALPAKIRAQLTDKRAILARGFDKCIYGFTPESWEKIAQEELLKPLLTEEGRRMRQAVFSQAEEVDCDNQGRFVIPGYLKDYAGIGSELVVIGAGDHFEIWDSSGWEEVQKALNV